MAEFDNTNSGASFVNDRKTSDNHPDYKGSVNVDGVEYWIASWVKTAGPNSKSPGAQFLSHALSEKEIAAPKPLVVAPLQQAESVTGNTRKFAEPNLGDIPADDDIPFN